MTSKATKNRQERKTNAQKILSLSFYINKLEKYNHHLELRIINLENQLEIKHNVIKKDFITERQIKIYFEYLLQIVCKYYNTTTISIFRKDRSGQSVKVRRIIIYILRNVYNISEANIMILLKKEINFTIDRSTIYHHVDVVEGYIKNKDNSLNLLGELNDIMLKLTSNKI